MPRSNRRRPQDAPRDLTGALTGPLGGLTRRVRFAGDDWFARTVTGSSAVRPYLCPGCSQDIAPGIPHVVAWPADPIGTLGGVEDRRHWHTSCWSKRDHRPPKGSYR